MDRWDVGGSGTDPTNNNTLVYRLQCPLLVFNLRLLPCFDALPSRGRFEYALVSEAVVQRNTRARQGENLRQSLA